MRAPRTLGIAATIAGLLATAAAVRGAGSPKFYDDDPIQEEPASQDASGVKHYEPDLFYDLAENIFYKPGDQDFDTRARNVNTIDEVPDGAWFVNRAGTHPLAAADVARGANTSDTAPAGPWTIIAAKTDGITPGFTVRDEAGRVWFIKFDPPGYRGMATGTEVVVSKLFWALGYHTTEYYIAKLQIEALRIDDKATYTPPGGDRRAMRREDIQPLLKRADRDPDGSYRVIASLATPGTPVGRIRFYGTRPDDPNDLVPHEHRRELRGYKVFAAWFNHVDAKSTNSIDMLVTKNGRAYVQHYLLDFGSALGSGAIGPREYWEGYENLMEPPKQIGRRILTVGIPPLDWHTDPFFESRAIGRLRSNNAEWNPDEWQPRVPNAAFLRARADDRFWAARKAMAITDGIISAVVEEGQFGDPESQQFLVRALRERRDAIGRKYLPAINPVVDPVLSADGTLTFANAAVQSGFAAAPAQYTAAWSTFDNNTGATSPIGASESVDTRIAAPAALPSSPGAFVRIELSARSSDHPSWARPVHIYFRRQASAWQLVGFERLPDGAGASSATLDDPARREP